MANVAGPTQHSALTPQHSVGRLEERLGVRFRSRALLELALTHKSAANEMTPDEAKGDNERLELLGDAVLSLAVAEHLYRAFPGAAEGALTVMRAELVRGASLARWARGLDLGRDIVLGRGEERTGGRGREAVLAACFEAVVGALYLDRGYRAVQRFLAPFLREAIPTLSPIAQAPDAKSELQRRLQAVSGRTPSYRVVRSEGPEHRPLFTVEVRAAEIVAQGTGRTKRVAEQDAASRALEAWNNVEGG